MRPPFQLFPLQETSKPRGSLSPPHRSCQTSSLVLTVPSGNRANMSIMIEVVRMKCQPYTAFPNILEVVISHILTTNPFADHGIPPGSLYILLLLVAILGLAAVVVDAYDPFESNVKAHFNVSTINKFHPTMSMSFAQVPNLNPEP